MFLEWQLPRRGHCKLAISRCIWVNVSRKQVDVFHCLLIYMIAIVQNGQNLDCDHETTNCSNIMFVSSWNVSTFFLLSLNKQRPEHLAIWKTIWYRKYHPKGHIYFVGLARKHTETFDSNIYWYLWCHATFTSNQLLNLYVLIEV